MSDSSKFENSRKRNYIEMIKINEGMTQSKKNHLKSLLKLGEPIKQDIIIHHKSNIRKTMSFNPPAINLTSDGNGKVQNKNLSEGDNQKTSHLICDNKQKDIINPFININNSSFTKSEKKNDVQNPFSTCSISSNNNINNPFIMTSTSNNNNNNNNPFSVPSTSNNNPFVNSSLLDNNNNKSINIFSDTSDKNKINPFINISNNNNNIFKNPSTSQNNPFININETNESSKHIVNPFININNNNNPFFNYNQNQIVQNNNDQNEEGVDENYNAEEEVKIEKDENKIKNLKEINYKNDIKLYSIQVENMQYLEIVDKKPKYVSLGNGILSIQNSKGKEGNNICMIVLRDENTKNIKIQAILSKNSTMEKVQLKNGKEIIVIKNIIATYSKYNSDSILQETKLTHLRIRTDPNKINEFLEETKKFL